jgi:hypothetical protein
VSRRAAFRQSDVSKAVRGAQAAGVEIARVEIGPDGRIILVTGKPVENLPAATEDALDRELAEFEAGHATR